MKKFLIVGLGNIGAEYEGTRHNIGFEVMDAIAKDNDLSFSSGRYASFAEYKIKGRTLTLLKPTTYMNLSGKAVRFWMQEHKIPVDNLLVVTDDLSLPFAKLRMKGKGSAGGHNGLANIEQLLGSSKYARLRMGIGDDFAKGHQIDYVLGKFSDEQSKELVQICDTASKMVQSFALQGLSKTMNDFN